MIGIVTCMTPTAEDRALANEALAMAVSNYCGRTITPASADNQRVKDLLGPAVKALVIEMELAIVKSRLREQARCAKIAAEVDKKIAARIRA